MYSIRPLPRLAATHWTGTSWSGLITPLSGMISWDNMKSVALVSGTANPANRTFELNAMREGGGGRGAAIDGQISAEGWLVANIKGPNVDCHGIKVQWFVPPPGGGG